MRFLIVDDMPVVLEEEAALVKEIMPECEVIACTDAAAAIEYAGKGLFHAAFLDIELGKSNMDGIILAKKLKDIQPHINIVFATAYNNYAMEAFSVHATGYLLKPIQKEQLERELTFLYGEKPAPRKRIRVQTFGNFEVWVDDKLLNFGRQKSKELFAYLVERKGSGVTTREACSILFEDGFYDHSRKNYFQTIVVDLKQTFKKAGIEDVILKSYNHLAVDIEKIDCDYYRFLNGDIKAVNQYNGEFMANYSWAEFVIPTLNKKIED